MKKVISIMFVAVLLFGAVACGGGSSNAGETEVAKMWNRQAAEYTVFTATVAKAADAKEIAKLEIDQITLSTKLSKEYASLTKKFKGIKGNSKAAIKAYRAFKAARKASSKALEAGKKKFAATDATK